MMPRKKRRTLLIISIVLILLIGVTAFTLVYLNTDMFKSDSTLFAKYMGQSVENMDEICQKLEKSSEFDQLLKESKYTTQTQVKINAIQNRGTSSENTQNAMNQLKLEMNGQTDKKDQYNYQDIKLLNDDEKVAEIKYIQNEDTYGIEFSDIFSQYILVNNENLKDLFEKLGYTEEQLESVPDTIEFNPDFKNIFHLEEEEKQTLKNRYIDIINKNVTKEKFSKQKNQTIQIDGKNVNTNVYTLTLAKEQMNDIYIKMLEEMKQDDVLSSKIDQLQNLIKDQIGEEINLQDQLSENIDQIINDITRNNIGQEETKISVYENFHTTKRILVQNINYEMRIDFLSSQEEDYIEISSKDLENEKETIFQYKKGAGVVNVKIENKEDEISNQYTFLTNEKVRENSCTKMITIGYEDDSNEIELNIEQEINIVDSFEEEITLNEENSINLSELEKEDLQSVLQQVIEGISAKANEIVSNNVDEQDLIEILETIGFSTEYQNFETVGVTETEKNRFNSKFEIMQGKKLKSEDILNLIEAIQNNFIDIEVVSETELRLKLDQYENNEDVVDTLTEFIKENKSKKYDAKVEYDEETGLVSSMILTIVEE